MTSLPPRLLQRLAPAEAAALHRALAGIGDELKRVYVVNAADHRESRGDNAQLFGLKVWVHGRHHLALRFEHDPDVRVVDANGSYCVLAPPLSIGVYKLGDSVHDDIYACFPDTSATKRSYGERNRAQLSLFDESPTSPISDDAAAALNELIVGHFGNPRDGLVKWYVGAYVINEEGRPAWAWIDRQDLPGEEARPATPRPPIVPFDAREAESLEVRPRRGAAEQAE